MRALSLKKQLFRVSKFSLVYLAVKFNALTAALFLSNLIIDKIQYGLFEYALSLGIILAIPFNAGLQGAYPFFNVKLQKKGYSSIFFFHALIVSGILLVFLGGQLFYGPLIAEKWNLALLVGGIIALQVLLSVIWKSHERIYRAVCLEGGIFILINGYNLYLYTSGHYFEFSLLYTLLFLYLVFLFGTYLYHLIKTMHDFSFSNYKEALAFGRPVLFAAFLIIILTGSARIFIEYFLGMELVGIYGLYFRLAAVTVLIHQIANIVFFKKIYQSKPEILDHWFGLFCLFLALLALLSYYAVPFFLKGYFTLLAESWNAYHLLFWNLNFQMIVWIGMALYENVIYREELSGKLSIWFMFLILLMALTFWLFHHFAWLDIFSLTLINILILFLACEIQNYLLFKKGIDFHKTRKVLRGILAFILFFNLFIIN